MKIGITFSILAFAALIVSICIKERKKSLVVQSLNCLFEAIYDFIILAYTGAILSIINFVRTFLFINKEKFSKTLYLIILFLFESIIIVNCILTWGGLISLLPTIGSLIRTYCLWQSNMKLVSLKERGYGIFEGMIRKEINDELINSDILNNYHINKEYKEIETIQSLCNRVWKLLDKLKQKYKDNNILLVTHGGTITAINGYFNGINEKGIIDNPGLKNCEIKLYEC